MIVAVTVVDESSGGCRSWTMDRAGAGEVHLALLDLERRSRRNGARLSASTSALLLALGALVGATTGDQRRPGPTSFDAEAAGVDDPREAGELLAKTGAARMLSVSERTVERLVARGELPVVRVASAVRFASEDVAALVARRKES